MMRIDLEDPRIETINTISVFPCGWMRYRFLWAFRLSNETNGGQSFEDPFQFDKETGRATVTRRKGSNDAFIYLGSDGQFYTFGNIGSDTFEDDLAMNPFDALSRDGDIDQNIMKNIDRSSIIYEILRNEIFEILHKELSAVYTEINSESQTEALNQLDQGFPSASPHERFFVQINDHLAVVTGKPTADAQKLAKEHGITLSPNQTIIVTNDDLGIRSECNKLHNAGNNGGKRGAMTGKDLCSMILKKPHWREINGGGKGSHRKFENTETLKCVIVPNGSLPKGTRSNIMKGVGLKNSDPNKK